MTQDQIEIAINKLIPLIKPKDVEEIHFDLEHTHPEYYTMYVTYVVDDDWSDENHGTYKSKMLEYNTNLRKQIKNYLGIVVRVHPRESSIMKHSLWYKKKF